MISSKSYDPEGQKAGGHVVVALKGHNGAEKPGEPYYSPIGRAKGTKRTKAQLNGGKDSLNR
jgi:hypothetical protein